ALCYSFNALTVYQTWEYRNLLADLLRARPVYAGAIDDSKRLAGALPLMECQGPFGKVLNSLPFFGSYGGIIGRDQDARQALAEHYNAVASAPEIAAATLVASPLEPEPSIFLHDFTDTRIGQVTYLNLGSDPRAALLDSIDATARRNLRKAESSGVE